MKCKCDACKDTMIVTRENVCDVILFKKKYYHINCFRDLCEKRGKSNRGKPEDWRNALIGIEDLQKDTQNKLEYSIIKDEFNVYLLANYDVVEVTKSFWQLVAGIENGIYKRKKVKPVKMEVLMGAWKWGQQNLNKIAAQNEMKHTGPQDDNERLNYDLAILMRHIPAYLKEKAKNEAENQATAAKERIGKTNAFDYEALSKQASVSSVKESNDILDLMNEIF